MGFREKDHRSKAPFSSHHIKGYHPHGLSLLMLISPNWGNKDPPLWKQGMLFRIFLYGGFVSSSHSSTMCLYYCGLVDIHITLWVVRQYCYFILLLQLLWLWTKDLFQLTPVYLWHHPLNVCWLYLGVVLFDSLCFEHFLYPAVTTRWTRIILSMFSFIYK